LTGNSKHIDNNPHGTTTLPGSDPGADLGKTTIRYQYDNHLGSASLELDEKAEIISYEEYHPFGTTSYRSGRSETETSLKRYKYVGKERDNETGLYYYGARYYAAWLCRFVSVDPLQFDYPQLTPYNYAGNKPVTHIDIDGMQGTGDEKRGEVINAHKQEMISAQEVVKEKQEIVDNLERNPVEKKSKGFKQYKIDLRAAKSKLNSAKKDLKTTTKYFQQVEDLLNEYAYYDPNGYKELQSYTDHEGNPIDVYIKINPELEITQSSDKLPYGHFGRANYILQKNPKKYEFWSTRTEEFGQNTLIIELAPNNFDTSIAHEKGHLDSEILDFEIDFKFYETHLSDPDISIRHAKDDPSGESAKSETTHYRELKKKVIKEKGYFDKHNPNHQRK